MTHEAIAAWYNTCRVCGRERAPSTMYAYYAGNYCSDACYNTLFTYCMFCNTWCMAAQEHLQQHGKRLCDACFDKHQGIVLSAEQAQKRVSARIMHASWRPTNGTE